MLCKFLWVAHLVHKNWKFCYGTLIITVRLLLLGSLKKKNWPIRLQDKNDEIQPKPIEPIMSRWKTTVKNQQFGIIIILCSYPTVI